MALTRFDETRSYAWGVSINDGTDLSSVSATGQIKSEVRIDQLLLTSTDVIDHEVTVRFLSDISEVATIGTITLPALSGQSALIPAVDVLPGLLATLDGVLLNKYDLIVYVITPAMTATKVIESLAIGGYL